MNSYVWKVAVLVGASVAFGSAGGYWLAKAPMEGLQNDSMLPAVKDSAEKKALYWYDPMFPQQKFDKPGKSPFMEMQLVPKYAEVGGNTASVQIDPSLTQNIGMRLATVSRGVVASSVSVVGVLAFNERDIAVVQSRTAGFVERVYARAPGDVLSANAALVDILVPDWAGEQEEFLALKRYGDPDLLTSARQRLRLAGMPPALIAQVERSGKVQPILTITNPIDGVLQELDVREGMAVAAGETLARVNGLSKVWLNVAVPEAAADSIAVGQSAGARFPTFPGQVIQGKVSTILPDTNPDSRTIRVRIELPNPEARLRPGLTAHVVLNHSTDESVLWVPSEAIIRTGKRALVMIAEEAGRYRPAEVQIGQENDGKTAILKGLEEGQHVVASGQFLLDSEASLKGIVATPLEMSSPSVSTAPALHESQGKVLEIDNTQVKIAHGPFNTLGMPGMTMTFPLANAALKAGIKPGDKVRFSVSQNDDGLHVEQLEKSGGKP
ncbi:efflux RND transporter periplasmic adaptor subunit [Pseudomonas sp. NPDC089422]|uniref:efflux RND transporter periplasmic adaptor subunit n=1 Tax=Pseudomonas sp. NPDC089422 TaxID=3364466 RepID=UPI00380FBC4F